MEIHQISNFTYTDSHSNPSTLESKIRYLEEKMVQLQFELAAEKQYLDSERAHAYLSREGNVQPQPHFPQCPMASSSISMVDPLCPLHGSSSRMSSCPTFYSANTSQMAQLQSESQVESQQYEPQPEQYQSQPLDQQYQNDVTQPVTSQSVCPSAEDSKQRYSYETPASRIVYQQDVPFKIFEKEVYNTDNLETYSPAASYFDELKDLKSSLGFGEEQEEEPLDDPEDILELDGDDYLERLLELDELCKQEMKRVNDAAGCLRPLNQLASDWEVEKLETVLANGSSNESSTCQPVQYKDVFEDLYPVLSNEGGRLGNTEDGTSYHSGSDNDADVFSNDEDQ